MPLQEREDVPDPVRLVGVRVHVSPADGRTMAVSPTLPLKPSRAVIVNVVVPLAPASTVTPG